MAKSQSTLNFEFEEVHKVFSEATFCPLLLSVWGSFLQPIFQICPLKIDGLIYFSERPAEMSEYLSPSVEVSTISIYVFSSPPGLEDWLVYHVSFWHPRCFHHFAENGAKADKNSTFLSFWLRHRRYWREPCRTTNYVLFENSSNRLSTVILFIGVRSSANNKLWFWRDLPQK